MTLVGKKLQDIYDSGAKALLDLQKQTTSNFEQTSKDHAQSMKQLVDKSAFSLQEQSSSLQADLKKLTLASLERMESVLLRESEQNQAYVLTLVGELKIRTEQMKSKLSALGQSHQENVDFAFDVACQHYLSDLETIKLRLDESASHCLTGLSAYGATVTDNLLQKTEQSFWQLHKQSQATVDSFFSSARAQEGAVADHVSKLTERFTKNCENKLMASRTLANEATEEVEAAVHSLLDAISSHASFVEGENKNRYAHLTESHFQNVDGRLGDFADELSNLHDNITSQLLGETEELSASLLSASTQAQEELRDKCDQSVNSVNSDFENFKQRLDNRLQFSRGQKQTLEDDKNKILIAIKNELLSIYDFFAKKAASLLEGSRLELTNMTKSVEAKIQIALETCDEQVSSSAASVQKQIEDEVAAFLKTLSDSRTAAVDEISSSASGSLPLVHVPEDNTKVATQSENHSGISAFELEAYTDSSVRSLNLSPLEITAAENKADSTEAGTNSEKKQSDKTKNKNAEE